VLRRKLTAPITAEEIPLMMICVKMSRLENSPSHIDSLVDIAGYAETCAMVLEAK
jgi:hypothetical protein